MLRGSIHHEWLLYDPRPGRSAIFFRCGDAFELGITYENASEEVYTFFVDNTQFGRLLLHGVETTLRTIYPNNSAMLRLTDLESAPAHLKLWQVARTAFQIKCTQSDGVEQLFWWQPRLLPIAGASSKICFSKLTVGHQVKVGLQSVCCASRSRKGCVAIVISFREASDNYYPDPVPVDRVRLMAHQHEGDHHNASAVR